jgi:hypothetical protein
MLKKSSEVKFGNCVSQRIIRKLPVRANGHESGKNYYSMAARCLAYPADLSLRVSKSM